MFTFSDRYALFGSLVSLVTCVCVNAILFQVVRKRYHVQLSWAIPMAAGYTTATAIAILYDSSPRYWSMLARAGSYPLLVAGIVGGSLMIYGWIMLAAMFFKHNLFGCSLPSLNTTKADTLQSDAVDNKDRIWPPPPAKPK